MEMSDTLLHLILSQINTLQDKADAVEGQIADLKKAIAMQDDWLESVQSALRRADDAYQRVQEWIRDHDA